MIARIRSSQFVRHGSITFAGLMFANVFHYVYYALVARAVGVANYGVVTALFSAILIVVAPSIVAATIVAKLASEFHAAGESGRLRRLADVVDRVSLTVGVVSFAVVALASPAIARFFHLDSVAPVLAADCALTFQLVLPVQRAVLQGRHRFGSFAASNIVEALLKSILGPLMAVSFGASGALGGLAIASLAAVLFNAWSMRRDTSPSQRLRMPRAELRGLALRIGLAIAAINLLLYYDVILVRHFFSAEIAGLYGAAALVGRAIYTVVGFAPTVVLPTATQRAAAGESPLSLLWAGAGAVLAVAVVGIVACAIEPALIVRVISGPAFVGAAPYVLLFAIALSALAGANVVAMYKIGLRRYDHVGPLVVVALGEITVVALRHATIHQVLVTLTVGHVLALGVTLYRVAAPLPSGVRPVAVQELTPSLAEDT